MFELKQIRPEGGDCTAPYDVILDREYTVREFVEAVLTNRPKEWGTIYYCMKDTPCSITDPCSEYERGYLECNLPDDILDKKIVYVTARGGWSMMNYFIR